MRPSIGETCKYCGKGRLEMHVLGGFLERGGCRMNFFWKCSNRECGRIIRGRQCEANPLLTCQRGSISSLVIC